MGKISSHLYIHLNLFLLVACLLLHYAHISEAWPNWRFLKGEWKLLMNHTGVVPAHMALTHHNTILMFDRMGEGQSSYPLRRRHNGKRCVGSPHDLRDQSCYAHSIEYDLLRNKIRPLNVETDPWGSSGSMLSNGSLLHTGGFCAGSRMIRAFHPCGDGQCDWSEDQKNRLSSDRWYSSSLRLPEKKDRAIVVGGRGSPNYEFVPKRSPKEKPFNLPFLHQTLGANDEENNLYPILHLHPKGHLFLFANRDSILLDHIRNKIVKKFPRIPGGGSRSFPSSGSSVILPLHHKNLFQKMEVMICGGAALGALKAAGLGKFLQALRTCGRMVITGNKHKWKMEQMPGPRLMHDMITLPNGHVLLINGAKRGIAGWNSASKPALEPYLYNPTKRLGNPFKILKPTKIPRMYHSSALLLPNGHVLVAGSNPNNKYTFKNVSHPTEMRLQSFIPPFMGKIFDHRRPQNVTICSPEADEGIRYGEEFAVRFLMRKWRRLRDKLVFTAHACPFTTHSMSMNQRMLILKLKEMVRSKDGWVRALLEAPPSPNVAPSGHYMLSVVNNGIPSLSQWIKFAHP